MTDPDQLPALPEMTIGGNRFIELKAMPNWLVVCGQCDLADHPDLCAAAIDGAAQTAFGGDCQQRDVVYRKTSK